MRRALSRLAAATLSLSMLGSLGLLPGAAAATTADPPPAATTQVEPGAGLGVDVDGASETCTGPPLVCPGRTLFGFATPRVLALGPGLTDLETAVAHRSDLVGSYQDFTEPIYTDRVRSAVDSGRTPVVTWEPFYARRPLVASYPLAAIAAGRYDAYLRRSADQAAAVRRPFIIRFGHEMNGFWYPWGQPRPLHPQSVSDPANTPGAYVAAYRHVVEVFRDRGADNVVWMWSPNLTDANLKISLASLYPGDRYVDVVGLSGYLEKPTDTFEDRYRPTMAELATIGIGKPVIVAETGAVAGADRAPQLRSLLTAMTAEPRVVGVVYFSQPDKATNYRLDGDDASLAALRGVLDGAAFTAGPAGGAALARTPVLTGVPRVGTEVRADWSWRGDPERATGSWLSCPTVQAAVAACTRVGWGAGITVGSDLRGRYLRATLGVLSRTASDYAVSRTIGPVLTVPTAVTPAGIDLLSGSVRVRLPAAAPGTTQWLVRLDGGAATYLPASTAEHFLNGLAVGSTHTLTLAACDCPSVGPVTTASFTVVPRPAAPAVVTGPGRYTVTLPAPAAGQTGWVAVADGVEEELPASTATVIRTGLSPGSHSFGLRAVGGQGRTNGTYVYPQVS
ncbi:MAG: glycosyl hydrolase [Nocardioidaceae bacterium]